MRPYCWKWWSKVNALVTRRASRTANEMASHRVHVGVSRQQLLRALLLCWKSAHNRQPSRQQPLTRDHSPKLADQEGVSFGLDVVRDEARPPV